MKFQITRSALNQALSQVSRLASPRMPLPILNNILLTAQADRLVLAATDLEIGIQTEIVTPVEEVGTFTVPARLIQEFVQASRESTWRGFTDGASLNLVGDQSETKIRGLDSSEFPEIPFIKESPTFQLKAAALKEAIELVGYAAALDETRPVLTGVRWHAVESALTLAATDSYRLAERRLKTANPVSQPCSVIVLKRTLMELARLLADETGDISVFVGENQIQFEWGLSRLVSRLIEGNYPDYQAIIPNEHRTRVTVNLGDCLTALKLAQLFAREAGNLITLTLLPGKGVTVQAAASQRGEATNQFTALTEGEELTIGLNVKYLLDSLQVVQADNIFLEFNGPDRPVVIKPANSQEYLALVMPLKL